MLASKGFIYHAANYFCTGFRFVQRTPYQFSPSESLAGNIWKHRHFIPGRAQGAFNRFSSPVDIAEQAMVSKSTALNLFRKYLHITPVNYLINYRLKQAGQLLSKTEKKVSLISSETGFHNVDYFCRLFKKRYKLTPTEYRKQKHFL